ncbi:MAG: hypothetical protein ACREBU_16355, partial [Nitrososphaera sp.]
KQYRGVRLSKFDLERVAKYWSDLTASNEYDAEKDDWSGGVWAIYHRVVKRLPVYEALVKAIPKIYQKFTEERFSYFCAKAITLYLNNRAEGFFSRLNLIDHYLTELEEAPLLRRVDLQVSGIFMIPDEIRISSRVRLNKMRKADIEEAIPVEDFIR